MGSCASHHHHQRKFRDGKRILANSRDRKGTDSSAPLNYCATNEEDNSIPRNLSEGSSQDALENDHLLLIGRDETTSSEIYYDAVEEENKFPLTISGKHHFEEFSGLEERLAKALAENNKAPLRNSFTDPPAHLFMVRGPDYLRDGKGGKNVKSLKVPSQASPYELVGVNMFRSPTRMDHIVEQTGDVRRYVESFPADKEGAILPEFLFVNWLLSPLFKKEFFIVQHAFRLVADPARKAMLEDSALMNTFARFKKGTDEERNSQLKYMFRVVDAPQTMKSAISFLGGERPVLIGKSLQTTYNVGRNYMEINMDVSSSKVASAINGIVLKNVETVVMDCAWLLEGQTRDELPERILAKIRWIWNCAEDVIVPLDETGERI